MPDLNPKQARFVEEYLKEPNSTQAYIRAGYAERGARANAARLIALDSIRDAIGRGQAKLSERVHIDQAWVLSRLAHEAKLGADTDTKPNASRIRAIELLGKHIGMFVDRSEVTVKRLDQMSEEELETFIGDDAPEEQGTRH